MSRPFRSPFGVLLAILCASQVVGWSTAEDTVGIPKDRLPEIERAIEAFRTKQGIPGLSVALIRDGERWTKGFGFADLENKVPAKPETMYRTASIAKPITAVALLKLVEAGKIDLDADIREYVPSFPEKKWKVTPRQLLAHLGGIRWYKGQEMTSTRHFNGVVEALSMFSADPLEHKPGTRYLYSTYGYNLLGAAVEKASGRSFLDELAVTVFKPSGMTSTRDDNFFALIPNRTRGYRRTKEGEVTNCAAADTSNKIPGGGLLATAEDIAAFGSAFLAGKLLNSSSMQAMLSEQKNAAGMPVGYGLGWNLSTQGGRREVSHGGGQPGTSTLLYLLPKSRLSIAIMSNLEGADLKATARTIADLVERGETASSSR